jgi:hypothetical protein
VARVRDHGEAAAVRDLGHELREILVCSAEHAWKSGRPFERAQLSEKARIWSNQVVERNDHG